MKCETYRFKIDAFECMAVRDFMHTYTASRFFTNAPAQDLGEALREHSLEPEEIPSPFTCLFIDTGTNRVLVDTGAGIGIHPEIGPYEGRLRKNLQAEGIGAADIDTVILTHGHPDHVGGNTDGEGNLIFANARYVMWKDEWGFWTSESGPGTEPQSRVQMARKNLLPIENSQLDLIDRETEVVPGICALDAKGHTPGHMAVAVSPGRGELLYTSDTVLHQLHLEHPEWHTDYYDHDLEQAAATKRRIFDRAAAEQSLVLAFHFFPFPGMGHVIRKGDRWEWQPIDTTG